MPPVTSHEWESGNWARFQIYAGTEPLFTTWSTIQRRPPSPPPMSSEMVSSATVVSAPDACFRGGQIWRWTTKVLAVRKLQRIEIRNFTYSTYVKSFCSCDIADFPVAGVIKEFLILLYWSRAGEIYNLICRSYVFDFTWRVLLCVLAPPPSTAS